MIENIVKGWITTILGCIAMCWALYGYVIEGWDWKEASGLGGVGFCLLFMREKIPGWLEDFKNALLTKFGLSKTKKDE